MYQLSTDYEKLFELVCNGEVVAAFVDYSFRDSDHVFRDICSVKMNKYFEINIGVRGVGYSSLLNKETKDDFLIDCIKLKLGWIEP